MGNATINSGTCQTSPELPLKNGRINNVLLSQTITLALNVRFSSELADFDLSASDSPVTLSMATKSALTNLGLGTNVSDILELANRALAGQSTGGLSLSAVNSLVDSINEGFEGECGDCGDNGDDDSSVRLLGNNPNPFAVTGSRSSTTRPAVVILVSERSNSRNPGKEARCCRPASVSALRVKSSDRNPVSVVR
jgi:hypothetical protein